LAGLKIETMIKTTVLIATFSVFLSGCNMNPSKEARIQKLETGIQQSQDKIEGLETRVRALESQNEQLQKRIIDFEKQLSVQVD
jgi:septal ring factor EnvC (AmiA/AmiB activator)